MGQQKYLKGVPLIHRRYRLNAKNPEWDHDHCEFCSAKFAMLEGPEILHEGYATLDDYRWICPQCFSDFQEMFGWTVTEASDAD